MLAICGEREYFTGLLLGYFLSNVSHSSYRATFQSVFLEGKTKTEYDEIWDLQALRNSGYDAELRFSFSTAIHNYVFAVWEGCQEVCQSRPTANLYVKELQHFAEYFLSIVKDSDPIHLMNYVAYLDIVAGLGTVHTALLLNHRLALEISSGMIEFHHRTLSGLKSSSMRSGKVRTRTCSPRNPTWCQIDRAELARMNI